jgi:alanine racemase
MNLAKPDVWVEIDLSALRHNASAVKQSLPSGVALMAVVKGNGFGHSYVEPAKAFVAAGAAMLGVTRLEEALELRNGGVTAPILLLAPIQADNAAIAIENDLICAVDSLPLATALSEASAGTGVKAKIHIKVDTGMGRLGVLPDETPGLVREIASLTNVDIAGIFTHFATATEKNLAPAEKQLQKFGDVVRALKSAGLPVGIVHAANSAATLRMPAAHLDMVRVGTLLYGQYPAAHLPKTIDLRPTWRLKARLCSVREVPTGTRIGYGGEYVTQRKTRIGVCPIGFADGFTMIPEGPFYRLSPLGFFARKRKRSLTVTIHNRYAPVLGRVSMQLTVVDLTDIPKAQPGDEVIVPALRLATNPHIPRVYLETF